ncbi:MAG: cation transporter [Ignavibacteria bacterium]|nr:cation transporter [Ignavibacteria bacterium]
MTVLFTIEGMTCHHCVMAVTNALKSLGIDNYSVEIGSASVTFDEEELDVATIKAAIEEEGYKVTSIEQEFDETDEINF